MSRMSDQLKVTGVKRKTMDQSKNKAVHIPLSKTKLIIITLLTLFVLAGATWMAVYPVEMTSFNASPFQVRFVSICCAVFSGTALIFL